MSCPGAMRSGFSRSPLPARSGPRDEKEAVNGAGRVVDDRRLVDGRRRAGRRGIGLDGRAVGVLQVHGRHEVEVGVERVGAGVDQDHAHAAGLLHRQALVDAGSHAAVADHDLAGHLGRVEHGRAVGPRR